MEKKERTRNGIFGKRPQGEFYKNSFYFFFLANEVALDGKPMDLV
jgi:hypothetical protein